VELVLPADARFPEQMDAVPNVSLVMAARRGGPVPGDGRGPADGIALEVPALPVAAHSVPDGCSPVWAQPGGAASG
jgi:hypothetical protein